MCTGGHRIKVFSVCLLMLVGFSASADDSASGLIAKMEALLWAKTNEGEISMIIETPYWKRALELRVWMNRPQATFIRVLSPKKEKGIGSLRKGSEMWNYIPKIDRVIKVPPSMMLQPWMGSDFSNDDLVKESSLLTDYTHRFDEFYSANTIGLVKIISTPKPDSAVVWGRIESWVDTGSGTPTKQLYFDESGTAIKELQFSEVQMMDGRSIPTLWVMQPLGEEGKRTKIKIKKMTFDRPMDKQIFTERNLRSLDW